MPFYTADWLGSVRVRLMTLEQSGAYFNLLVYSWLSEDGGLKNDEKELAILSGLNDRWSQCCGPILECFYVENGRLYNKRLLEELKKFGEKSKSKQCSVGILPDRAIDSDSEAPDGPDPIALYPVKGGEWPLYEGYIEELERLYESPEDQGWVYDELRKAKAWLIANPSRQKTARGMPRFLNGWMQREAANASGRTAHRVTERLQQAKNDDYEQESRHRRRNGNGHPTSIGDILGEIGIDPFGKSGTSA